MMKVNNNFNITIKVLGWGKEWKGFMDKLKNMYEYICTLPDDAIVFFVDGFDTTINQPLRFLEMRFLIVPLRFLTVPLRFLEMRFLAPPLVGVTS